jgi:putative ABC transport system permease protein
VLPPQFDFPPAAQVWLSRETYERYPSRTAHNWRVIGRLADGVSLAQARTELHNIAARLKQQYGQDTTMSSVAIVPLLDAMTSDIRPALWILLGAVGFLLLIACANVANLLLVQSAARQREIAIRFALGASRARVVRQLVSEALLLSIGGAALGVLAAFWGLQALLALFPDVLPGTREVAINAPVLGFSLAVCFLVALALGVFSGLRTSSGVQGALAAGGRSQAGEFLSLRTGRAIVAGQLAVTLALLTGAALLGRSLLHVLSVNTGFRTEHVVTVNLPLGDAGKDDAMVRRVRYLEDFFTRVRTVPGVEVVGGTSNLPLMGFHPDGTYVLMHSGEALPTDMQGLEKLFHDKSRTGDAEYAAASADYFQVLGIPLLRGRVFTDADAMNTPHVAIISDSLARQKWPNQDPLGHQIEFGNMDGDLRLLTVVGVVGDVREDKLEHPPSSTIYVNYRQRPQSTSTFNVVIRATSDPSAVITQARQILRDLDPNVAPKFATFEQVVSGSLAPRRFNLILVGVFAATALFLALAGMYGVMAHAVTRRTNEIGVRMALGASRMSILGLVLGQGLLTAAIGVSIGIVAAFAVTRTMGSLLFGLSPTDPATFAGVALLLTIVALLASYLPARRATQVDPMVALRKE